RQIELGFRRRLVRGLGVIRVRHGRADFSERRSVFGGRFALGVDFLARPALQKTFRGFVAVRHRSSLDVAGGRRPSESRVTRSPVRLTNNSSTWCSCTKAATVSRTTSGIGTGSTMLLPAAVMPSPSA